MSFKKGFEKTAAGILPAIGKGILGVGKAIGKGASFLAGGTTNALLTGLGAASDYKDISSKMTQAAQR